MSATDRPFYSPADIGCFDIATSSTSKDIVFNFTNESDGSARVPIPESKVVVYYADEVVETYAVGSGIALSEGTIEDVGTDIPSGVNNKLTLTIDGTSFVNYAGVVLSAECSFFIEGDVELTFSLKVEKSQL